MLPHYVEAYKATDEARGWAEEEEKADSGVERQRGRETPWSSESLSVTLYSSYQAATQTNTSSRHTDACACTTHTYVHVTQTRCHHILKPSKCGCQKGSTPDSLPQPSRRIQRTGTLIMKRVAATTKEIKFWQSDRHTWRTHTPDIYIVKWTHGCRV